MRFIHTADWHLGNSMYRIDRSSEADAFLAWLRERIVAEKADALIVSGDIFDTVNPPTDARKKYFSFLSSLKETQCMTVIITGGNHDSGMLLDAPASVLEDLSGLSVRVVGSMSGREIGDVVFEIHDASGAVCGICVALPYMREMDIRHLVSEAGVSADAAKNADDSDAEPEELMRYVYTRAFELAEKLRAGRDIPIIATGHLYAADLEGRLADSVADSATQDAEGVAPGATAAQNTEFDDTSDDGVRPLDIVGKLGRIHSSVFPAGFDYVALGHIHYTTMVAKNPKIRYSGSPFVLGFDESYIPHHVLCVDVGREKQPDVTKLEVPQILHFTRVSGTAAELTKKLAEFAANPRWPAESFFVEVCHAPEIGLNIHEELESVLKDAPFTVANWKIQRTEQLFENKLYEGGLDGAGQLTEEDIFSMLVQSRMRIEKDSDEYKAAMSELYPLFQEISLQVSGLVDPDEANSGSGETHGENSIKTDTSSENGSKGDAL